MTDDVPQSQGIWYCRPSITETSAKQRQDAPPTPAAPSTVPRLDQAGVEPVLDVAALRVHEVGLEARSDLRERLLVGLEERELQRVVGAVRAPRSTASIVSPSL